MTVRVALEHRTRYRFDRLVALSPHEVRLRPAPHCRTPVLAYSLKVRPEKHFLNWQQDPYGNWLARLVFPERADELEVVVSLVADMTVINPFDFFVERYAESFPFEYTPELRRELGPFLEVDPPGPRVKAWIERFMERHRAPGETTIDFLVDLNLRLAQEVRYVVRMEPGVQAPEETLELARGSCRDSGWLMVQILRHLGLAARFASGYLIQLKADVKALDGPSGTEHDFTDLHAWAEVYIPGAGWIGLDPTSGLLAGEGHIPLACTAMPGSAAPVIGFTDVCDVDFGFHMNVTRVHEDPRVTLPYTPAQWAAIDALGLGVDRDLEAGDVRLTQGGEPTFVSIDDMDGPEWNFTAHSPKKLELAQGLLRRLARRFGLSALLHFGQGKWYPGEPLPRWALSAFWRTDGKPLWQRPDLLADAGSPPPASHEAAGAFLRSLAARLGLDEGFVITAYEDVPELLVHETRLPENLDPLAHDMGDPGERARFARLLRRGLEKAAGYVLPLKASAPTASRPGAAAQWASSPWPLKRERLYLLGGDSPMGLRLPLDSLPWVLPEEREEVFAVDPFAERGALAEPPAQGPDPSGEQAGKGSAPDGGRGKGAGTAKAAELAPREVIKTALCVEVREALVHVFLPPLERLEDFVALIAALEATAADLGQPIRVEGYGPPTDPRLARFSITPDPGVIEVNIMPAASWPELRGYVETLYEEARLARLGTEKFMLDGRHTGTGGGNHVTLGGRTPGESPLLRRPDLLRSLITYWQHHPALSYLFSGTFIGPTSQAPRVDEARDDNLYELEIAFQEMARSVASGEESAKPWLVDRLLRNLLVDMTGNTHRAEFSIDKLYSPDGPTGRLGLLEFRAFEMPPHAQMSLVQMLLLRALVARFWKAPYAHPLVRWGTRLHDEFMLPFFVERDLRSVVADLARCGYPFQTEWFAPFLEFRFPRFGSVVYDGIAIELRQGIEPWHVLGEEVTRAGTARYVDSSVERLQVRVSGIAEGRHAVTCNGRALPLVPTGLPGEYVAGVRFRAWAPPSALHPTIGVHAPLVFDLVDLGARHAVGGCTYHVSHPGGRNYDTFPVNANEAEARRMARFWPHGHSPGPMDVVPEPRNPAFPSTLDLRRQPDRSG